MTNEGPLSDEELEVAAERTVNDAELIGRGAEYVNGKSSPRLEVTANEVEYARKEMDYAVFRGTPSEEWTDETRQSFRKKIDNRVSEWIQQAEETIPYWSKYFQYDPHSKNHPDYGDRAEFDEPRFQKKFKHALVDEVQRILGTDELYPHLPPFCEEVIKEATDKFFKALEEKGIEFTRYDI